MLTNEEKNYIMILPLRKTLLWYPEKRINDWKEEIPLDTIEEQLYHDGDTCLGCSFHTECLY